MKPEAHGTDFGPPAAGRGAAICATRAPIPPTLAQLCNERHWPPQPSAAAARRPVPAFPSAPRRWPARRYLSRKRNRGKEGAQGLPPATLPPVPPAPGVMQHRPPSAEPPAATPPRRGDAGHPRRRGRREVEALPPPPSTPPPRVNPRSTASSPEHNNKHGGAGKSPQAVGAPRRPPSRPLSAPRPEAARNENNK
ncbi:basic proline-rich protein-like [Pezoporus flaviventris]|uniref:basic proline-rich protein-like n=1 Tax=Pezoporus flaviventris TaxID=889875 RepID=UPI002AB17789|nr:basic proline-rich protein-like [Pezoporus flaviventris]